MIVIQSFCFCIKTQNVKKFFTNWLGILKEKSGMITVSHKIQRKNKSEGALS
ncbi:hypothetical protein ANACAC_02597 [Anaerostipes caccae L1-92]|uniref:Uncharacterized protein n=1 Tax=Anaerostipes caccae (strain DSM 14662 / CCUG 47493 / JCM 13470 / NCIMB 13811 / L1-92) TaxID=411490 RepID=B0MG87_ANACD|nr:hypothetical protein ANACAC_02597 [Anaerostipes caccae L1-92]